MSATCAIPRDTSKSSFYHSFGRPTTTKWRDGCFGRWKFAFHHSFERPTSTKWRERCLPPWPLKPTLRSKRKTDFKEGQHFRRAAFLSAAFLSSPSQQPFASALLSSISQQLFSAAPLSSLSQQPFLAVFVSSFSQQPSWAIILQWSGVGGQLLTSSCCGQGLVVILLWSGVGGQLFSIILLWSVVGGQLWQRSWKKKTFATRSVKTEIISTSPTKTSIWKPSSVNSFAFPITLWTHPLSPGAAVVFPPWSLYPKTPSCRAFGR